MKHRSKKRQFGRVRAQRKALERTMLGSLIVHGRIETTEAKAKELKNTIDKMITLAKRAETPMERVRKLEGKMPLMAIKKFNDGMIDQFKNRTSGYTRVIKMSPRTSDGARRAIIEFVDGGKEAPKEAANLEKVSDK